MEALLGVIIGGIIGIFGTIYTTRATLRENRRKIWQDYLTSRMDMLASSLAEYEEYLAKYDNYKDGDKVAHANIIGKAIAACLSISDVPSQTDIPDIDIRWPNIPDVPYSDVEKIHKIHRLAYIANKRLTRNFVKKEDGPLQLEECEKWGLYQDRNRDALDHATKRLAQLIGKIQKDFSAVIADK
jgi:hypothetical protein